MHQHLKCLLIGLVGFLFHFNLATAQHCRESIKPAEQGELAYQERGDRCEGFVIQKVGSVDVAVIGMTSSFESFENNSTVEVSWQNIPGELNLELKAISVKPLLFYRMDTAQPLAAGSFTWSTDILNDAGIEAEDISLLAVTTISSKAIHVPVSLGKSGSEDHYTLLVGLSGDIEKVYFGHTFVGKSIQDVEAFSFEDLRPKDLGYGRYSSGEPLDITIPFSELPESGFYALRIVVLADQSESADELLFFFHEN
jgi:hypothetical protein